MRLRETSFRFYSKPRCNQDSNETILETLSMLEKALMKKACIRSAVHFKIKTCLVLFAQVINKHLRMNASINLESLTGMSQHFGRAKCAHTKKI